MKYVLKEVVTRSALLPRNDGKDEKTPHKVLSMKAVGAGKELSDEQLAKINSYARKPLAKEQVFYIQLMMGHNGIDRDVERFNEDMLAEFTRTLPGKGFFVQGHPSGWSGTGGPGDGLFFDAHVEQKTPEDFKAKTGEDIKLPEGVTMVHCLMADAYILGLESNSDTRAKIDAGIIRFASIGFKAPLYSVTDDNGNHIYGEYQPKGEALEGSLVWLGAQPGAGVMKGAKDSQEHKNNENHHTSNSEKETHMKLLAERLSKELGKEFSVENLGDEIAAFIADMKEKMASIEARAKDGEAYRDALVDDTLHYGAMIGEYPTTEAGQRKESEFIKTWPLARIKMLKEKHERIARKMYPDKFTIQGKEQQERERSTKESLRKQAQTGQKRDLADAMHNPLLQIGH